MLLYIAICKEMRSVTSRRGSGETQVLWYPNLLNAMHKDSC